MALPTILYNASSGSDTAASGAGPATAVTGSAAAHTNGSASTTITLTNSPDLFGVATDGSAALWMATSSGRRLSRITAVDDTAKTVTVGDSFTIASGSPVDYAIGGKRQTLEGASWKDWQDYKAGWVARFESGTYAVTAAIAPSAGDLTDGPVAFEPAAGATAEITTTSTIDVFAPAAGSRLTIRKNGGTLTVSANSTGSNRLVYQAANADLVIDGVAFDSTGRTGGSCLFLSNSGSFVVENCNIFGGSTGITTTSGGRASGLIRGNAIHDCVGDGITMPGPSSFAFMVIERNLIYDNGGDGIDGDSAVGGSDYKLMILGNTIHGNAGDGVSVNGSADADFGLYLAENAITGNGGYGVDASASVAQATMLNRANCYGSGGLANTSGARNNLAAGDGDVSGDDLFTSVTDGAEDFTPASGSALLDVVTDRAA